MGVVNFGSSDSRDCGRCPPTQTVRVNSTPDPTNFVIRKKMIVNGYPILVVQYIDVLNYEGIKVLMYENNFDFNKIKNRIDPHFFKEGDSPIARFVPNEAGIELAKILAKKLP